METNRFGTRAPDGMESGAMATHPAARGLSIVARVAMLLVAERACPTPARRLLYRVPAAGVGM
jgi:hypothetical protein